MVSMEVRSDHTKTVIRLTDQYLEIERAGGFSSVHRKGSKRIPLRAVSAVQLKPPGMMTAGFLQLTISGGKEGNSTTGVTLEAARDENSVLFVKKELPAFTELRDAIQEAINGAQNPAAAPGHAVSVADELVKLAQLRDAGILTPAEFDSQKARLLR